MTCERSIASDLIRSIVATSTLSCADALLLTTTAPIATARANIRTFIPAPLEEDTFVEFYDQDDQSAAPKVGFAA
jgi:hypothetical protein